MRKIQHKILYVCIRQSLHLSYEQKIHSKHGTLSILLFTGTKSKIFSMHEVRKNLVLQKLRNADGSCWNETNEL
jgi:hypothetical protein